MFDRNNNTPFTSEDQRFYLSPIYWIEDILEEQEETKDYVAYKFGVANG